VRHPPAYPLIQVSASRPWSSIATKSTRGKEPTTSSNQALNDLIELGELRTGTFRLSEKIVAAT